MELTSLDLYNCEKLTGVFGPGWGRGRWGQDWKQAEAPSPEGPFQETSFFLLTLYSSTHTLISPGNIEVFKGMQIKELNLADTNLSGE